MLRQILLTAISTAVAPVAVAESAGRPEADRPEVVERIDREIEQQWTDFGIRPSKPASDGEWARRLYLDLIGRIPTVGELAEFQRAPTHARRNELARRLLYDDEYTVAFAHNWATVWTNLLIGRSGGTERNSLIDRDGMQKYLRDAFARNRPYNLMVQDLLTAEGTNKPGTSDFNGAVNFLVMKLADQGVQATADTARILLGKQVQCTQCHDHPFNEWKQNQFWELNSFFRQAVPLRRFNQQTGQLSHVLLSDQDFAGEGNTPDDAEVYFELRDATLQAVYPVFVDGTSLANRSGRLADVHRRDELARFVLASDELPKALVNRTWSHFFNRGFTTPIDDMGPHNPPTHPELLDYLAEQFRAEGYDLRKLMTWIVTSAAYSLSSRVEQHNQIDDPSLGQRPLFSHYYVRQMRAEELFDSLLIATQADRVEAKGNVDRTRRAWLDQFVIAFGNDEGQESSTFDGTISQSLVLFNGDLIKKALAGHSNSLLYQLARKSFSYEQKVDMLFLSTLARRPGRQEQIAAQQLLQWNQGDVLAALQDLLWAILNSNEFILNH